MLIPPFNVLLFFWIISYPPWNMSLVYLLFSLACMSIKMGWVIKRYRLSNKYFPSICTDNLLRNYISIHLIKDLLNTYHLQNIKGQNLVKNLHTKLQPQVFEPCCSLSSRCPGEPGPLLIRLRWVGLHGVEGGVAIVAPTHVDLSIQHDCPHGTETDRTVTPDGPQLSRHCLSFPLRS